MKDLLASKSKAKLLKQSKMATSFFTCRSKKENTAAIYTSKRRVISSHAYSRFSRDVTAAMLVYRTVAKKVFWDLILLLRKT